MKHPALFLVLLLSACASGQRIGEVHAPSVATGHRSAERQPAARPVLIEKQPKNTQQSPAPIRREHNIEED